MRYSAIALLVAALGCSSPEKEIEKDETISTIDSIIGQNQKNLIVLDSTSKRTDAAITGKVEKTVKQITTLKQENLELKTEKMLLAKELQISKLNVRIDTVYIETKKNFWGKEKTSISTKSETTEFIDTAVSEKKVIDTTLSIR
jgi:hypothetical protein